jgi:hypothetical protein
MAPKGFNPSLFIFALYYWAFISSNLNLLIWLLLNGDPFGFCFAFIYCCSISTFYICFYIICFAWGFDYFGQLFKFAFAYGFAFCFGLIFAFALLYCCCSIITFYICLNIFIGFCFADGWDPSSNKAPKQKSISLYNQSL